MEASAAQAHVSLTKTQMRIRTVLILPFLAGACMPALGARPARVSAGPSLEVREAIAVRAPSRGTCLDTFGDIACDYPLPLSVEAVLTYGTRVSPDGRALSIGAGAASVAGTFSPFLEVYQQRRAGEAPWGIGVRVGVPTNDWTVHALEVRGEGPARGRARRVWTTTFAAQSGGPPDDTRGTALSLGHAEGVALRGRYITIVPSLFVGIQHAQGVAPEGGALTSPRTRFRNAWSLAGGFGGVVRIHRP